MEFFMTDRKISWDDLRSRVDGMNLVRFNIGLPLDTLMALGGENGLHGVLEDCTEHGCGYYLDIVRYRPVGAKDDTVVVEVTADAFSLLLATVPGFYVERPCHEQDERGSSVCGTSPPADC